jgi:hypothetical protein
VIFQSAQEAQRNRTHDAIGPVEVTLKWED